LDTYNENVYSNCNDLKRSVKVIDSVILR